MTRIDEYASRMYYQRLGEIAGEQDDVTDDDGIPEGDEDVYDDLRERLCGLDD